MNHVYLVVATIFGAVLQALIPSWPGMGYAKAPILLGLVLYYSLTRQGGLPMEAALMAGFLQDALDLVPMGHSMFTYALVVALLQPYQSRIFGAYWFTHVMLGALSAGIVVMVHYVLLAGMGTVLPFGSAVLKALGAAGLAVFTVPIVFKIVERYDHKLGNIRLREAL